MIELGRFMNGERKMVQSFHDFLRSLKSFPQDPKFARIEFSLRRSSNNDHSSSVQAIYKDGVGWIYEGQRVVDLEELIVGRLRPDRLNLITNLQNHEKGNTGFRQLKNGIITKLREKGYTPSFAFFKLGEGNFLHLMFPIDYKIGHLTLVK